LEEERARGKLLDNYNSRKLPEELRESLHPLILNAIFYFVLSVDPSQSAPFPIQTSLFRFLRGPMNTLTALDRSRRADLLMLISLGRLKREMEALPDFIAGFAPRKNKKEGYCSGAGTGINCQTIFYNFVAGNASIRVGIAVPTLSANEK
jgi:hypothetical protein